MVIIYKNLCLSPFIEVLEYTLSPGIYLLPLEVLMEPSSIHGCSAVFGAMYHFERLNVGQAECKGFSDIISFVQIFIPGNRYYYWSGKLRLERINNSQSQAFMEVVQYDWNRKILILKSRLFYYVFLSWQHKWFVSEKFSKYHMLPLHSSE